MATKIGSTGYIGKGPAATYTVYLSSSKRISNSTMQYTFTVYYNMQYSESFMGSGNVVQCRIYVGSGSWSSWATLKSSSSSVSGTGTYGGSSITVTAPSTTSGAKLSVHLNVKRSGASNSSYNYTWNGTVGTVTTSALLYSKCSAPTSITCSTSIGKPSQSITVSWSGAKAGTNNSIRSYTVYYRYGAQPTTSAYQSYKTVTTTSTSGSTTIPISPSRGVVTYVKVRTNGSAGSSYYSSISSASGNCTTNSLPNNPSFTVSRQGILPSTGGSITYNVTAGSDSNSSQTRTLYYSRNNGTTKTRFTSPLTLNYSGDEGETFYTYFYTYDGLEYSNAIGTTATINTKPTCSLSVSTIKYNYNNSTYDGTFNLTATTNKSIKTFYYYIIINGNSKSLGSNSTGTLTVNPFSQGATPGSSFYFQVRVNDGIEYSNYATSSTYTIPTTFNISTSNRIYNDHNSSNVANTNGDFYQNIRVYLPYDEYLNNPNSVTATYQSGTGSAYSVSSINYVNGTATDYNNSTTYCDIIVPNNLDSHGTYNFTINITKSGLTRTYTFSKTRTYSFPGGSISGLDTIKPFTNTIVANPNIPAPVGFIENLTYQLEDFNLGDSYSVIKFAILYNNQSSTPIDCVGPTETGDFQINTPEETAAETIYFTIGKDVWYNAAKELNLLDIILTTTTVTAQISITNLFGVTVRYNQNITFNFQELSTISNFITKLGDTMLTSSNSLIREGQTFNWNYDITTYNPQTITSRVFIYRSDTNTTPNLDDSNWSLYTQNNLTISGNRNEITRQYNQTGNISFVIPQLAISKYIYFKIICTDIYNQTFSSTIVAAGASNKHISPNITVTGYSFEQGTETGQGTITINYSVIDNGGELISSSTSNLNPTLENSIQVNKADESEEGNLTLTSSSIFDINNNTGTITLNITNFTQTAIHLYLTIKTRLTLDGTISTFDKTFNSAPFIIYNINPTMSFRYQHIGINSVHFENDTVLVISPGAKGTRDTIYLEGVEGKIPTININSGEINDFIIDGGEW